VVDNQSQQAQKKDKARFFFLLFDDNDYHLFLGSLIESIIEF